MAERFCNHNPNQYVVLFFFFIFDNALLTTTKIFNTAC